MVRVAMAGSANTARNKGVESTMEFAFTDENLRTTRISSLGESKETIV